MEHVQRKALGHALYRLAACQAGRAPLVVSTVWLGGCEWSADTEAVGHVLTPVRLQ